MATMATAHTEQPPSGPVARLLTVAALVVPVLLPLAVLYQRRARHEVTASHGRYQWPRSLWNRPVALYLSCWLAFFVVMFLLSGVFAAFAISPA
jgi:ABC-type Fe3+ transport system permease subunit